MKRSKKKGPFLTSNYKNNINHNTFISLQRNFEITSKIIGLTCQVYDGKQFLKLNISENMVGHKLGEFVPTRAKFIFKKKKKIKMGQKINPNILRLGISKCWKTEFFEKSSKELPRYTFKDLELKNYAERFLNTNGLLLHNYRQNHNNSCLTLFLSYFITPAIFTKIKKKKITKILLINNKGEKKWIVKINNLKLINSKSTELLKPKTKNPFSNFKSKISLIKLHKYLVLNHYLKLFILLYASKKKNFQKIESGTFIEFLKTIHLFTKNTNSIMLNVSCFNKELKITTTNHNLKRLTTKLKRFRNTDFFKAGIELLLNSVANKNSAHLLSKHIAQQIKNNKRHKFFLSFLKKVMTPLLKSNISVTKGLRIKISGRLNGAPKAKHKIITIGDIPTQSIDSFLDYSQSTAHTKNGTYGVKVWLACKI